MILMTMRMAKTHKSCIEKEEGFVSKTKKLRCVDLVAISSGQVIGAVSYTHLDVYKRQHIFVIKQVRWISNLPSHWNKRIRVIYDESVWGDIGGYTIGLSDL